MNYPNATSTITGRTGRQEDARAFASAPKLAEALRLALAMAPGTGEYISAQDSRAQMDSALAQYLQGNYGPALNDLGGSFGSAAGAVPFLGMVPRLAKYLRAGKTTRPELYRNPAADMELDAILASVRRQPSTLMDDMEEITRRELARGQR